MVFPDGNIIFSYFDILKFEIALLAAEKKIQMLIESFLAKSSVSSNKVQLSTSPNYCPRLIALLPRPPGCKTAKLRFLPPVSNTCLARAYWGHMGAMGKRMWRQWI